ncbi:adenosylcobinamide-phosphate synthase CbiB [Rhabdaerophilum calidifontis]|uniref:adenosylcobinamide-phosphate synthase CbiB n=1 Tax=Rhabdaerophilum calidifontis TaxID=2604328 RepID=UPI001FE98FA5|nr:adenosylcobinamide-phosphate synthase CbiB [Rhabdaerophilum calidifontis]
MSAAAAMLVALAVDAAIGWPRAFFARIRHPVVWIGALITALEQRLNREGASARRRRLGGIATLLLVTAAAAGPALLVEALLPAGLAGVLLVGLFAWPLVAARALDAHVAAVARPLAAGDLAAARAAVAMIVGRDPEALDAAGIARAAIESLAENASDGVVAPLFWGALLGLPGIAAYKAVNTLDSMIGHRSERFAAFGWASARFDDLVNLAPARLTGLLLALAAGRPRAGLAAMLRDAPRHRSPNAGWPEAAMADALGVRLSGPRRYGARIAEEPYVNAGARDPGAADIGAGLRLYRRALVLLAAPVALLVAWWGM